MEAISRIPAERKIEVLRLVKKEYARSKGDIGLCTAAYWLFSDLRISHQERMYVLDLVFGKIKKQGYMYTARGSKIAYNPIEVGYVWPLAAFKPRITFLNKTIKKLKNER